MRQVIICRREGTDYAQNLSVREIYKDTIDELTGKDITPQVIGNLKGRKIQSFKRKFSHLADDLNDLKFSKKIQLDYLEALGGDQFVVDMSDVKPLRRLIVVNALLENNFVDFLEIDTPKYIA